MKNIILSSVAIEELVDLIACEVETRIIKHQTAEKKEKKYITRKDLSEKYHISLPTITKITNNGKLPAYRIGGRVLFIEDEVQSVLEKNTNYHFSFRTRMQIKNFELKED